MIRGFEQVVMSSEVEAGRFYLEQSYQGGHRLLQCVVVDGEEGDPPRMMAVDFTQGSIDGLTLTTFTQFAPLVLMPHVDVRIDPPSMTGTNITQSLNAGMLFVYGDEPFVTVRHSRGLWAAFNINTGHMLNGTLRNWVAFQRWLLVVEENGQEVAIAEFG